MAEDDVQGADASDRTTCSSRRRWVFLFQAEDGIRDLVRSRGLGDVYKRQGQERFALLRRLKFFHDFATAEIWEVMRAGSWHESVSYTHLTLPTSDLV